MQCAVCDAFIDEVYGPCPYCGHIGAVPDASAPPLIAAHDLPIVYANADDDPPLFPFEQEHAHHVGLKRLLLFLIAAEMLIACIGLMTLPGANTSRKPPTGSGQTPHHNGETFERIVVATKPDPKPIPTAPMIAVAPAVVVAPHAKPHHVAPAHPPTRPTPSPTFAPPTSLPTATVTPVPPSTLPMPTLTATPLPSDTPTPTIPATTSPTIVPTPISTPSPVVTTPTPLTPEPTVTH